MNLDGSSAIVTGGAGGLGAATVRRLVDGGMRVVAAVVPVEGAVVGEDDLRDFVRARLRSTRTPERIEIRSELPFNETGKLLRRVLRDELEATFG